MVVGRLVSFWESHHFDGIYQERWGFSEAKWLLVSGRLLGQLLVANSFSHVCGGSNLVQIEKNHMVEPDHWVVVRFWQVRYIVFLLNVYL